VSTVKNLLINHPSKPMLRHGDLAGEQSSISINEASDIVKKYFGIIAKFKRFESEKDDTFLVNTVKGEKFVLKVANANEKIDEIKMQQSILKHIQITTPSLPVPRIKLNVDHEDIFQIEDKSGTKRYARMITFIEGTPLCDTNSNSKERQDVGRILARLEDSTKNFSHSGADRYYAWDVQNLLTLEPLLKWVSEPSHRSALEKGLERFEMISPILKKCRKQILHNDFSKSNIIVDHKSNNFVKGIIDFGDTVRTAIAVDVSTALLNQLPEKPHNNIFADSLDLMEGYSSIATLTNEELEIIPHLVMGRVVARALITHWRKNLFPDNETYIMRNTERGWHQLDWFLSRPKEQISDILIRFSI